MGKNKVMQICERIEHSVMLRACYTAALMTCCPYYIWKYITREYIWQEYRFYNILLFVLVEMVYFAIFRMAGVATNLTVISYYALYTANDVITQIRGIPLAAGDIFSFRTAMSVASEYVQTVVFSGEMLKRTKWTIVWLVTVSVIGILLRRIIANKKGKLAERVVAFVLMLSAWLLLQTVDLSAWDLTAFWHNDKIAGYGYALCFYKECRELYIAPPEGYKKSEMQAYLNDITVDTQGRSPDIIVIMNEAWADLGKLGTLEFQQDAMPYIHEMVSEGKLLEGEVIVPVWGEIQQIRNGNF